MNPGEPRRAQGARRLRPRHPGRAGLRALHPAERLRHRPLPRGAAVFFTRQAGLTPTQLGTGLALAAAFGLAALLPLGAVADRFGARATLVGALLWRALCFVGLAFVQGPVAFTVVAACQAAAQSITAPVTQALVGTLADEGDRTRMMAVIRTVRNVGFSLGALAAAPLLLADGVWLNRGVLLGNAVAFVAAAVPVARLRLAAAPRPVTVRSPLAAFGAVRDWRYVCLTALNAVLALHMTLLAVGLPLWVTHHSDVPDALVPFLVLVTPCWPSPSRCPSPGASPNPGAVRAPCAGPGSRSPSAPRCSPCPPEPHPPWRSAP
ncbi:MFS transporter [Streptomyces sp. CYG20]|uniref:MFS transporter n=1 Tax=Streptomyces sp. CYG20 TaxID=2838873 RepID=UPI0027E4E859|nr:MFS transporter [Streptomyces sp. CYG20]